jgi:hypothetical protein
VMATRVILTDELVEHLAVLYAQLKDKLAISCDEWRDDDPPEEYTDSPHIKIGPGRWLEWTVRPNLAIGPLPEVVVVRDPDQKPELWWRRMTFQEFCFWYESVWRQPEMRNQMLYPFPWKEAA